MTRVPGALLALLLALTACGDDGPSAAEKRHDKAVASIAEGVQDSAGDSSVWTDDEAECAGTTIVDKVGVDALVEQKVLEKDASLVAIPDRPSRKLTRAMIHGVSDCMGIVVFVVRTTRSLMRTMAEASGTSKFDDSDKTWKRVLKCAKRQIPEKAARKAALRSPSSGMLPRNLLERLKKCDLPRSA